MYLNKHLKLCKGMLEEALKDPLLCTHMTR